MKSVRPLFPEVSIMSERKRCDLSLPWASPDVPWGHISSDSELWTAWITKISYQYKQQNLGDT
jgi:hypothetical protein